MLTARTEAQPGSAEGTFATSSTTCIGRNNIQRRMRTMKSYSIFAIALLVGVLCSTAYAGAAERVGRPVRILSLSFKDKPLAVIRDLIDTEAAKGVDMVVLPETWRGQKDDTMETLDGPTIQTLSALARKHHTYIVSPIDRVVGERRLNSAVLLDREGKVAFIYDKVYPYWSEFDHRHKVEVGVTAPVYQADFGKVGFAICFDVNFPEVWKSL